MIRKIGYAIFLASTALFAYGVWVYETDFWEDHQILFPVANLLLLFMTFILFWAGAKKGRRDLLVVASVNSLFWFLCAIPLIQHTAWVGSSREQLTIRVLDAKTGKPIPSASVRIESKFGKYGEGETDKGGKAKIEALLPASGTTSLFKRRGRIRLLGLTVKAESDSYEPGFFYFDENNSWWPLYGPPIPEIEIRLQKK